MTLKEAIEKAGLGGKIERTTVTGFYPWVVDPIRELITTESGGPVSCSMMHLTATDWEVIAPDLEIEVGDEVHRPGCNLSVTCKVRAIQGQSPTLLCIDKPECVCRDVTIDVLTLIRKASKKHVFEGVEFKDDKDEDGMSIAVPYGVSIGDNGCPDVQWGDNSLEQIKGNKKNYRMILEEIE
jgi:hypothetical protein